MRTLRALSIALLLCLLSVVFVGQSGATEIPTGDVTAGTAEAPQLVTHKGTAGIRSIDSACAITRGGQLGYRICEYDWFEWIWADGRVHTFVIGTNYAVYNIIQYAGGGTSGWRSLGGSARLGVYPDYVYSPSVLGIWVYGSDYNPWCRGLNGSWGSWYRC